MPIHYRNEVQKTLAHPYIGQIRAPDLVDSIDSQFPQKIGINLVLRVGARCLRAWVQSLYTHKSHQTLYSFAIDLETVVIPKVVTESAGAFERTFQVQLIQLAH